MWLGWYRSPAVRRSWRHRSHVLVGAILLSGVVAPSAHARPDADWRLCIRAGDTAAAAAAIPADLIRAIGLVETGRGVGGQHVPWPWAINHRGQGHWFETRAAAQRMISELLARGDRHFDVGCFQISYLHHGHNFPSASAMLSPDANATYAARFLASLQREADCWGTAISRYHSRTASHGTRYLEAVRRVLAKTNGTDDRVLNGMLDTLDCSGPGAQDRMEHAKHEAPVRGPAKPPASGDLGRIFRILAAQPR